MQCALWMQIGRGDLTKTLLHAMRKVMSGRCLGKWLHAWASDVSRRGFKERVERGPSGWSRSKWRRPKLTTLRGWWGRKLLARSTESVPRVVITNNNRRNPPLMHSTRTLYSVLPRKDKSQRRQRWCEALCRHLLRDKLSRPSTTDYNMSQFASLFHCKCLCNIYCCTTQC